MSSTFLKSLSVRIPLLQTLGASKMIASPRPIELIHPRNAPVHDRTTKILPSIDRHADAPPKAANISPKFLKPVATIFRLTWRMPRELSPNRLVSLGGRERCDPRPVSRSGFSLGHINLHSSLVVRHCLLCIICEREQGEAVSLWQIRSLYAPDAPFCGPTVNRSM